uniref:B30.2/SPRY domain-containing protein n=1 Tax=Neolamprologus brichardi TaxID=32507 RepID=A0A3Q4HYC0_NEOBR
KTCILRAFKVNTMKGRNKCNIQKPKVCISSRMELKITKFSCKFFGDFILDSNPTTFEEAMKTIAELPRILKEKGENAVPIKVWLTPLKTLGYGGAELVKDISVDSLRRIEDTLEALKEMKERCNDSLDEVVVKHFPQIKHYLQNFQKLCSDKISDFQRTLKRVLPSIREGRADESSLNNVFDDLDKSPYNLGNLSKCLDYIEREINIITSFLGRMEGIKIVQNKSELDRAVLATGVNHAFCFVFTGLKNADLNLDAMANEDPWYYLDDTLDHMKKVTDFFMDLYRAYKNSTQLCFLVAAIQHQNYKGATIYQYKEGRMITDNFSKPKIRDPRTIKKRSHFLWNTANNYLTLSEDNKKATCGTWQTYPDHPQRFDGHTQVLCKQPLTGRHYWEVEWSAGYMPSDVRIAVAYKEIGRKGRMNDLELGCNKISWYFGVDKTYHDNKVRMVFSLTRLGRVGVYLDWPAGTLSFYDASSNSDKLVHLYTFETKFSESVYPGFYIYYPSNYLNLNYPCDGPLEADAPVRVSKKSTHCFRSTVSKLDSFGQSHVISDVQSFIYNLTASVSDSMVYKEVNHSRDLWSVLMVTDSEPLILPLRDLEPASNRGVSVVWEYFELILVNRVGFPALCSCCLLLFCACLFYLTTGKNLKYQKSAFHNINIIK